MPTPPIPTGAPAKGDRIAKLLARAGVASRREIERMIDERRVALDGRPLETPATVLTSLAGVTVDGRPVAAPEPARLFLYHKPPGLLVTERDPAGRATIYDRLPPGLPRTVPVGRLDLATEGLLLLTTDGGLKRALELPATGVERTYRARAYGTVSQAMLEELIEGVEIDGVRYGPIDANLERRTGANVWIELTLTEGKNREVRRVLEHLGLEVSRLIRTRYGPFILADLPPGEVGEVAGRDLANFTRTLTGTRRAKGADLQSLVAVAPRAKPAPAPVPAPPAKRRPTPQRHPGEACPERPPQAGNRRGRGSGAAISRSERSANSPAGEGRRNERSASQPDPGLRRGGADSSARTPRRPGKGPAGGRGHPPRPPKGKPRKPR